MVRAGDLRDVAELLGPRNALEELERMEHVGLDLPEFLPRQAPARDREDLGLLGRDDGVALAEVVYEGANGDAAALLPHPAHGEGRGYASVGGSLCFFGRGPNKSPQSG